MKRIAFYLLFVFFILPWAFLNYGLWIDTTQKPEESDIIICLGGGTVERLNKAVNLFTLGYSRSESVVLLGESYDTKAYLSKRYPNCPIEQHHTPTNTKEEVLYIKKYMLGKGYASALIVTDPPHSRRVSTLDTVLSIEGESELSLRIISSEVTWWKAKKYYDDERSLQTVLSESLRIGYSLICYGLIERLGVACE